MTDDEKMDELIRGAAADYNRPPAVPRDAMWEAIQARRAGRVAGVANAGRTGSPGAGARQAPRLLAFPARRPAWLAAAAVALLAVGIGIGRVSSRDVSPDVLPGASTRTVAGAGTAPGAAQRAAGQPAGETAAESTLAAAPNAVASVAGTGARGPADPSPAVRERVPSAPRAARGSSGAALAPGAYNVATTQHLRQAEALLVLYRADAREGKIDAELAGWARDLLSTTRLLLDSPAGRDPLRRRVLEDLELVLVQIVQIAPDSPAEERELLERAIERGGVMTPIRTTTPAGSSSGTE